MEKKENNSTRSDNRRDFLKKTTLAGLAGVLSPVSDLIGAEKPETTAYEEKKLHSASKNKTITILITTDIHAQLFTHDEFF